MQRSFQLAALAVLAFAAYTPDAQAYIDPTAAGSALQSLYILLVSAMMAVALVPKKIAAMFAAIKAKFSPSKPTLPAPDNKDQ